MPLSCESIYNEVEKEAIAIANVCYELWAIDLHAILHNIAHSTTQQFPCIDRPCRRVLYNLPMPKQKKQPIAFGLNVFGSTFIVNELQYISWSADIESAEC